MSSMYFYFKSMFQNNNLVASFRKGCAYLSVYANMIADYFRMNEHLINLIILLVYVYFLIFP